MSLSSDNDNESPVQPTIKFPVLEFGQGLVNVVESLDYITNCRKRGYTNGWYKGLVLVDAESRLFRVLGARKLKTLPFNFTFRDFLEALGGNPRYQVELVFAPNTSRISLDKVKKLISESFRKEKNFWSEMTDFEQFRDEIARASSIDEIFGIFRGFNRETGDRRDVSGF